jgi:polyisoprenoid-binding protein YceI
MKKLLLASLLLSSAVALPVHAANYVIDTDKAHAFIQFKISHLGYSFVLGRFNKFTGEFSYDEKSPNTSKVTVNIDPASIDSAHAERDKHLRGKDFFDVEKFATAKFVSTSYTESAGGKAVLKGDLTLHGVTKNISIDVQQVGAGADPWGGYRRGFTGTTTLTLSDFGINYNLGPAAKTVEMTLVVEGIKK